MKKIGPFSVDIVVACYVYHYQQTDGAVPLSKLAEGLDGSVSKSGILNALNTLAQWGVVRTEFGELDSGRAGRLYSVSGESSILVAETYKNHWTKIQEHVRQLKNSGG